jgi:hypothetical protein
MAQIFVSHSAKDPFAESVRDKLVAKLREMGLTPLVDKEIRPGDQWRARLDYWIGCCHGAVLLFSRDAVDSDWVRKEATILTWRKALHPHLRLIPVLLGNVSPEELRQGYLKTIEVSEIEWIKAGTQTVDALVEKIAEQFLELSADQDNPGLRDWVEQVADCLKDLRQSTLNRAAELLQIEVGDWQGLCKFSVSLAHHLLHRRLDEVEEAVGELLKGLRPGSPSSATLCRLLEPLWVREEAARHILPATRCAESERLLAINTQSPDTGTCYVRRATCSVQGIPVVTTSGIFGEDGPREALGAFEKACRLRFLGPDEGRGYPEARREKLLQMAMRRQLPAFLLVPEQAVQREVIAALRHRFPLATFVLLSGSSFPDRVALGLPRLDLVVPELKEDEEDEALAMVYALKGRAGLHDS